eukprot:TRINITY_DN6407_c0_g1_i1.p1 TRINITY_DN6407_c0_g1~~TRINITY_DN6407_c0_g1_i1.p1  ORF type:complete len:548 (+),score=89.49 TRINITY_DN6407_c0_g1_i1:98-1645(+)
MDNTWKPYEDSYLPFERIRYLVLPPLLAKRFFFWPSLNLVGLTIIEILVALILLAGTVLLAFVLKDADAEQSGNVAQFYWIPLFLLILYRSPVALLFGISFERSMFWHGFFALLALGYGVWHGVSCMYWADLDDDGGTPVRGFQAFVRGEQKSEFISGGVIIIAMALLIITSIHPIRRFVRRIWLWSHHILAVTAVVFCALHGAGAAVAAFGFYIADRLFGYVFQAHWQYARLGSETKGTLLPSGFVRLSVPRTFSFRPGQFICINIPSISLFEYHTFSIATCPTDDKICVLIKAEGYWTKKLVKRMQKLCSGSNEQVTIRAFVHGPIGSVALDWQGMSKYATFVLVAGGVGITPLISFYRHVLTQAVRGRPVRKVVLIWAVRNRAIVDDVISTQLHAVGGGQHQWQQYSSDWENPQRLSDHDFSVQLYITRGSDDVDSHVSDSDAEKVLVKVQWNSGRPNLREVFMGISETMSEKGRVGVLGCGPSAMTREVVMASRVASRHGAQFDVHLEHFY